MQFYETQKLETLLCKLLLKYGVFKVNLLLTFRPSVNLFKLN